MSAEQVPLGIRRATKSLAPDWAVKVTYAVGALPKRDGSTLDVSSAVLRCRRNDGRRAVGVWEIGRYRSGWSWGARYPVTALSANALIDLLATDAATERDGLAELLWIVADAIPIAAIEEG